MMKPSLARMPLAVGWCVAILALGGSVTARCDDIDVVQKKVAIIKDLAKSFCQEVPLNYTSTDVQVTGIADAELSKALKALAKIGVSGTAKYERQETRGVLARDLVAAIGKGDDCRQDIIRAWPTIFSKTSSAVILDEGQILKIRSNWPRGEQVAIIKVGHSKAVADLTDQFEAAFPPNTASVTSAETATMTPPLPPGISVAELPDDMSLSHVLHQAKIEFKPVGFMITVPGAGQNPHPVLILSPSSTEEE